MRRMFTEYVLLVALVMLPSVAFVACGAPTSNPGPTPVPTPVAHASATASASAHAAPTASASAPMEPPEPVPSQAVLDAANRARGEVTSSPSEFRDKPKRECSGDACIWNFDFASPGQAGKGGIFGLIGIDEKSLAATFRTGDSEPIPLSVYVAVIKYEAAVVKAVAGHAEVKRLCANSARQGAPCTIYPEQMPTQAPCPANPAPTDACLWSVYVGSNMGSHVSRLATVVVEPQKATVVGIADLACPPIAPAAFRAREVRRAAKPPDDEHYCD